MEIFEQQKKQEYETVLPLINIVFLLLIFFMLAGTFIKPDLFEIKIPEANIDKSAERNQMIISMNDRKEFAVGKTQYSESELVEMIKSVNNTKNLIVQLKADHNVQSQDLINAMEMLGSTGLTSVRLLTVIGSVEKNQLNDIEQ